MRLSAVVLVLVSTAPLVLVAGNDPASAASGDCVPFEMPGVGPVCPRGAYYEVFSRTGESLGFTHGPDPVCHDCEEPIRVLAGDSAPFCVASTSTEYNVVVIYARASDDADRYSSMVGTIRNLVHNANAMVDDAAIATGDRVAIRVKCSGGVVDVANAVLPTSKAGADFSSIASDLQQQGFNNARKKYWVYYDEGIGGCPNCAGQGTMALDDSDSVNNFNNGNLAQPMFSMSYNSASVRTMLHELGHNLGAVQDSAPRSSGAGHCTDGRDTMCYNDGGSNSAQCQPDFSCSGVCSVEVFDCGKNTYCHASPSPGSYLDTHWQVCHRQSRYLAWIGTNVAPAMATLACGPDPATADEVMSCAFRADDASPGVFYQIDWGDGTTTREPASGTVAPSVTRSVAHTYATAGEKTIRVNATDNDVPPLTSADRTYELTVNPGNPPPVMSSISCLPASPNEDQSVTCTFSATDDSNVFYTIAWGDGSASQRVPASGAVASGAAQSASHTYADPGTFTFTATPTDIGSPAKTGAPMTRAIGVADVNEVPVLRPVACPTGTMRVAQEIACSFSATDDSPGVSFRIEWGDGTVTTTAVAPPGPTRSATHAYAAPGDFTVNVTATDDRSPPLTSSKGSAIVRVRDDVDPPVVTLQRPRQGVVYSGCNLSTVMTPLPRVVFLRTACIEVIATDASGVARVEVFRDGSLVGIDTTAPYALEPSVGIGRVGVPYAIRVTDTLGFSRTVTFTADEAGGDRT